MKTTRASVHSRVIVASANLRLPQQPREDMETHVVPKYGMDHNLVLGESCLSSTQRQGFYTLRYDFQPVSVTSKRGVLGVRPASNRATGGPGLEVAYLPETGRGEDHCWYLGKYEQSKDDLDCVAVFDGTCWKLELLGGQIIARRRRDTPPAVGITGSPRSSEPSDGVRDASPSGDALAASPGLANGHKRASSSKAANVAKRSKVLQGAPLSSSGATMDGSGPDEEVDEALGSALDDALFGLDDVDATEGKTGNNTAASNGGKHSSPHIPSPLDHDGLSEQGLSQQDTAAGAQAGKGQQAKGSNGSFAPARQAAAVATDKPNMLKGAAAVNIMSPKRKLGVGRAANDGSKPGSAAMEKHQTHVPVPAVRHANADPPRPVKKAKSSSSSETSSGSSSDSSSESDKGSKPQADARRNTQQKSSGGPPLSNAVNALEAEWIGGDAPQANSSSESDSSDSDSESDSDSGVNKCSDDESDGMAPEL